MDKETYQMLMVEETADHRFLRSITERPVSELPPGEVLVRVSYSSLNYKDALSATGNKGVTRQYPHTPGIDAAGVIEHSDSAQFQAGDEVIVTSYDLGMNTPGGFGQYIQVPADWVVKLPQGLSLRESMILGTAGLTAGMSVHELSPRVSPEQGDILVSGATGGVGSVAVAILARLGYQVVAASGKEAGKNFLHSLGAKEIIGREAADDQSGRPLLKERWAGVVDTVGGNILATAIKATKHQGTITCCGNIAAADIPITVYPFILRGVSLIGIDSQNCPLPQRKQIWQHLATDWKPDNLEDLCTEVSLAELSERIDLILAGKLQGRTLVNLGN